MCVYVCVFVCVWGGGSGWGWGYVCVYVCACASSCVCVCACAHVPAHACDCLDGPLMLNAEIMDIKMQIHYFCSFRTIVV